MIDKGASPFLISDDFVFSAYLTAHLLVNNLVICRWILALRLHIEMEQNMMNTRQTIKTY